MLGIVRQLELVAVELEEASRLTAIGRVPQLRLAYLLIDNASEIIMDGEVRRETYLQGINLALLRSMSSMNPPAGEEERVAQRLEGLRQRIVPEDKLAEIEQRFPAKVNFLAERGRLSTHQGIALRRLHRYRNDMYHGLRLSREVLLPTTLLYFDLACSMLAKWKFQRSWSSAEPYTDLATFGLDPRDLTRDDATEMVASKLRTGITFDLNETREALQVHLLDRLGAIDSAINFISRNVKEEFEHRDDVIKLVQLGLQGQQLTINQLRGVRFPVSARTLVGWRSRLRKIGDADDRDGVMARFVAMEDAMARFEDQVLEFAAQIDRMIQYEIDLARGK
jgi:hypothetical protein